MASVQHLHLRAVQVSVVKNLYNVADVLYQEDGVGSYAHRGRRDVERLNPSTLPGQA